MPSFKEQSALHRAGRLATASLETSARSSIAEIFLSWDNGDLNAQSVRHRLEGVIRSAYRGSAGVARGIAQRSSDIPDWISNEVFNTEYLQDLLADVRRNLRDYKSGALSREQAIYRMEHSAGVASQRGYTDQIIASYTELEDFGLSIRKYWVANFVDNTPCPACRRLHGTSVGLHESFRAESGEPGVYRDLVGPPRHPRCQCALQMFVVTLENAFESPNFENPQDSPSMLSTKDVKNMPKRIFATVLASLGAILNFFRGK